MVHAAATAEVAVKLGVSGALPVSGTPPPSSPFDALLEQFAAALAEKLGAEFLEPRPTERPNLPVWCSVAEYAAHIGKAPKTVRAWAARAPEALARKYGRDWRLAGPAFDAWVRAGGPFRVHDEEETRVH